MTVKDYNSKLSADIDGPISQTLTKLEKKNIKSIEKHISGRKGEVFGPCSVLQRNYTCTIHRLLVIE